MSLKNGVQALIHIIIILLYYILWYYSVLDMHNGPFAYSGYSQVTTVWGSEVGVSDHTVLHSYLSLTHFFMLLTFTSLLTGQYAIAWSCVVASDANGVRRSSIFRPWRPWWRPPRASRPGDAELRESALTVVAVRWHVAHGPRTFYGPTATSSGTGSRARGREHARPFGDSSAVVLHCCLTRARYKNIE